MGKGKLWSQHELDIVIKAKADGVKFSKIAGGMGRTLEALNRKYQKHVSDGSRVYHKWLDSDDLLLETEFTNGTSATVIANMLGVTTYSVRDRAQVLGVTRALGKRMRYIELLSQPHTIKQVAQIMGVKRTTVVNVKQRLKALGFTVWYVREHEVINVA